jgi:Lon-like ATP-dependent protease
MEEKRIRSSRVRGVSSEEYRGYVYNITTENGKLFVNDLLVKNSGGLGTPPHLRVEAGAIHRANKGVLFLDEVSSLGPKSQQDLLTAMQDKKYSITGQSELSSGAIVRTEPVPCDFVLVAAGNVIDLRNMHPALRSRIRGYGYEIYVEDTMPDTEENRKKLVQFVAQEVTKDGKIPHFEKDAVEEVIEDARKKAGRKDKLSLKLRELGGLVRAAGDIAKEEKAKLVAREHVLKAKGVARTLEQQVSQEYIDIKKEYQVFVTTGYLVGKVNGLAVLGDSFSGLILPIVAEVTPASSRSEGKLIATGKLGEIAKEAVENVSAIIKKHIGRDVSQFDIHVQFLQTYEGVEGDSASVATAVSVLSAMEGIAVDQSVAMTGSLSVRGEVLPVGGVTAKIEAAIEAGAKKVIIPASNMRDVYLSKDDKKKIKIVPARTICDVLKEALKDCPEKKKLLKDIAGLQGG